MPIVLNLNSLGLSQKVVVVHFAQDQWVQVVMRYTNNSKPQGKPVELLDHILMLGLNNASAPDSRLKSLDCRQHSACQFKRHKKTLFVAVETQLNLWQIHLQVDKP
jgi:hypothetical protein